MLSLRTRILLVVGVSLIPGTAITLATLVAERRERGEEARGRALAIVHSGVRDHEGMLREAG